MAFGVPSRSFVLTILVVATCSIYLFVMMTRMQTAERPNDNAELGYYRSAHSELAGLKIALNSDRTRSFSVAMAPSTLQDLRGLAVSAWSLNCSKSALRVWIATGSGIEVKNQEDYLRLVKFPNSTERVHQVFIAFGEERFRPINGAFTYLLTEGKEALVEWMVESLISVEKNFNSKYGPYPIIVFYNVGPSVIQAIIQRCRVKTQIYWVPVHEHFMHELPELPVFKNETVRSDLSHCANHYWALGYTQMIRFRSHFDYILSLDADAAVSRANFDFFAQAARAKRILGYLHCNVDWACLIGTWDEVNKYIDSRKIKPHYWEELPRDISLSGAFLMFDAQFWRSHPGVLDFMDCIQLSQKFIGLNLKMTCLTLQLVDMDHTGNMYFRRWAEQTFFAIAAALYAPYDQIYYIGGDYEITHYRFPMEKTKSCPGTQMVPNCCEN